MLRRPFLELDSKAIQSSFPVPDQHRPTITTLFWVALRNLMLRDPIAQVVQLTLNSDKKTQCWLRFLLLVALCSMLSKAKLCISDR